MPGGRQVVLTGYVEFESHGPSEDHRYSVLDDVRRPRVSDDDVVSLIDYQHRRPIHGVDKQCC